MLDKDVIIVSNRKKHTHNYLDFSKKKPFPTSAWSYRAESFLGEPPVSPPRRWWNCAEEFRVSSLQVDVESDDSTSVTCRQCAVSPLLESFHAWNRLRRRQSWLLVTDTRPLDISRLISIRRGRLLVHSSTGRLCLNQSPSVSARCVQSVVITGQQNALYRAACRRVKFSLQYTTFTASRKSIRISGWIIKYTDIGERLLNAGWMLGRTVNARGLAE